MIRSTGWRFPRSRILRSAQTVAPHDVPSQFVDELRWLGELWQSLIVSSEVHLGAMRRPPVSNRLKSEYVACAVTCSSGDEYVSCI